MEDKRTLYEKGMSDRWRTTQGGDIQDRLNAEKRNEAILKFSTKTAEDLNNLRLNQPINAKRDKKGSNYVPGIKEKPSPSGVELNIAPEEPNY